MKSAGIPEPPPVELIVMVLPFTLKVILVPAAKVSVSVFELAATECVASIATVLKAF